MRVVHKYLLEIASTQVITPGYNVRQVLHADLQNGHICLWAEVDTDDKADDMIYVSMNYTGSELAHGEDPCYMYVSTVVRERLLYHIYAKVDK